MISDAKSLLATFGEPGPNRATHAFFLLFSAWFALLIFFNLFPSLDLYVAEQFFRAKTCLDGSLKEHCGSFPYRSESALRAVRSFLFRLPYLIAIAMLWKLFACYEEYGATFNAVRARALRIALSSLVLGPILLVNVVLKSYWGRPRPSQTIDFGGPFDFVQAGSMAGKCLTNCSFVSGEAAAAGWLFCLAFLVPRHLRAAAIVPMGAISLLVALLRLSFGAHYLSDVMLGWLSSLVVFAATMMLTDSPHTEKKLKFE
ncbi:phosphatase PAP2 family protein [Rhizobium grahamii]|uniref:Phosphatase PAP2 family protein n=2 Tax=Rhizobium TaxID=379 RepID=A0A5Q0CAI1_9HYPH|nr:phosphatase PAP2 family protein [Rhizobium grahamii]QRM51256.1 phosphatase PAP2 family protein [Rhizobium sp. BG6]QRM51463.1 phosphatase PAP2 family protein [Rhizobium sp. BG6]